MTSDDVDLHATIKRLERRLDRERRARREAEEIAEAGMRSLYDANQELDGRILERTAELNRALEVAEAANNAKSSFLGQMSHQINTPLNGLLGMLELLASELPDAQSIEWHASAMRSARRLERLTTRLITYVELENADFGNNGEWRNLSKVLSRVHDRWHGPCLHSGQLLAVEVQPGTDASVNAPDELDLLFDELLSNVVEHAGPGAVLISGRMADSSTAVVEISDPGIGVDPLLAERAHELSASPNQTQRGDDKVNLGLALVDRIVEALGGEWGPVDDGRSAIAIRFPIATA